MKKSKRKKAIKELEVIEKNIKKVEKKIEKNWKKIILITAGIVILISSLLFITGIRIRLAIQDSLIINLNPSEKSFMINNDQEQKITFNAVVENSMFCKANCSYGFYDRSEDKLIGYGDLILKDQGQFNKTYTLIPYSKGSGQKIYNFDVKCSNIDSFLCKTESPIRGKSSFITLNYKLTAEEEKAKDELMPLLKDSFSLINNASKNMQRTEFVLNASNNIIGSEVISEKYKNLIKKIKRAIDESQEASNLWSNEDYSKLKEFYDRSMLKETTNLYNQSATLLNESISIRNNQKDLSNQYNNIAIIFMELSLLKEPYINIPVIQHNITEKFSVIYSYLISVNLKITKKTYSQLFLFENDLDEISKLIKSLNQTLERDYNSIVELGQNIYLLEYSKKCDIINCTDISNNSEFVCLGLKKIIDEYENNTFSIEDGLVINESYYIDEEGKIKIIISNESNLYYEEYCINETDNSSSFQKEIPLLKELEEINISDIQVYETIDNELTENLPQCCVYGSCSTCCTEEECKEDPELFPIVFIHGHSLLRKTSPDPLLDGFNKIQYQLQEDGYINAGTIKFDFNESDSKENEWGLSNRPITVKASYYYDYFYSLGSYIYITKSTDNIDTYAIRMNDIINLIKYKTGKPKVNIITHSMGGLVARRYIQIFGEDSVDKLILIASPNKGIDGDVKKFCQVFGEKNECEDLYSDSLLIKKLNSQQNIPKKIKQYTISGKGCKTGLENGDGVITFESSLLENSESFAINGTCTDIFKKSLHSDILDIDRYPQVYEYIKQILKS